MRRLRKTPSTPPRMFHYNELTLELHPEVYDPAEDTYLLLESIKINPKDSVFEMGTGCGLISLVCATHASRVVCSDINPFAVQLTRRNIERNRHLFKANIEVRQGDLFSVLKPDERFTLVLFNPPYLPTKKNDKVGGWFDIATDGGPTGLRQTKRFLQGLLTHLQPTGRGYFIFSSLSDRPTLENLLRKERWTATVIATRRFEGETLDVYQVAPTA